MSVRSLVLGVGERFDVDDLVAAVDIAARAGLDPKRVQRWARRGGYMPDPVLVVNDGLTKVYSWREVSAWLELPEKGRAARSSDRVVRVGELLSASEISVLLGWASRGTAARLSREGTFPAPVVEKPRVRLWVRGDVLAWASTARRLIRVTE